MGLLINFLLLFGLFRLIFVGFVRFCLVLNLRPSPQSCQPIWRHHPTQTRPLLRPAMTRRRKVRRGATYKHRGFMFLAFGFWGPVMLKCSWWRWVIGLWRWCDPTAAWPGGVNGSNQGRSHSLVLGGHITPPPPSIFYFFQNSRYN